MADTPYPLRGFRYNTRMTFNCPAFNKCPLCSLCQEYDRHNAICVQCESRKRDKSTHGCHCTADQKLITIDLQKKFDRPIWDLEGMKAPENGKLFDLAETAEGRKLSQRMEEAFSNTKHTMISSLETTNETVGDALGIPR